MAIRSDDDVNYLLGRPEGVVSWVTKEALCQGPFGEYNEQLFEAVGF